MAAARAPTSGGLALIDLSARDGWPVLRVGHRGAAMLAPENTLRSFRAARACGVDLIEFDVLDLVHGPLVLAHSDHLDEVSHGVAAGRVRDLRLEALREVAPELPTLDDALAYFADEAHDVGLHVDLKLETRLDELAAAVQRHGLVERTVVSSFRVSALHAIARHAPGIRLGFTYPEDKLSISRKPHLWPVVALGLGAMRAMVPLRMPGFLRRAGASAVMLNHRLVTDASVAAAHRLGASVLAWTVDTRVELERVVAAGVDGVITNDPRIFVATLNR